MSGARLAWVLASICTSVAVAPAAEPDGAAALELTLARTPAVYLVLERDAPKLSIRARALELDAVVLRAVSVVWQGGGNPPALPTPALWRVSEAPRAEWRRVVAPPELVPYDEGAEEPLPSASPSPTPPPPRPDHFSVPTDAGWRLAVAPSIADVAPTGFWRRVFRGWRRLIGEPLPAMQPTLVAEVGQAEDGRRLVHLFTVGRAVLVGGDPPVASVRPPS